MSKYYIIESTKENKNGHISHLMIEDVDKVLIEISPRTGRIIKIDRYWTIKKYLENNWKIVDLNNSHFVGSWRFRFLDLLEEKGLIK